MKQFHGEHLSVSQESFSSQKASELDTACRERVKQYVDYSILQLFMYLSLIKPKNYYVKI